MTTPNLPPLPDEDGYILIYIAGRPVEVNGYRNSTMEAYAIAAYQAGRDAGLEEGFDAGFAESGEGWNGEHPADLRTYPAYRDNRAETLTAMKANAEGGG